MKHLNGLIAIALMVSYGGFSQQDICGEPIFFVEKAICKAWYNRGAQVSSGWHLEINVSRWDDTVVLEEAYFRSGRAKLRLESRKGEKWLLADFEKSKKTDITPDFELKKDEAILSYAKDGQKRHCKIVDIKSEKPSFHQAMGGGKR